MLSKEGCEKALARIVNDDYYFENDPYGEDKASAFDKDVDMIEQLIEEHFKPKENTSEFKHFKLHSDSTLKNLTKNELIDYIKMLYNNWGVADEQLKNCINKAKELSDSNNELERTVCSLDYALSDVYNHKPYKFEELKPNMWVFDCVKNRVNKIIVTFVYGCPYIKFDDGFGEWFIVGYEENRFFPVQCANLES
jgi:hypothetical protein